MRFPMIIISCIFPTLVPRLLAKECPCGWRVPETSELFTHRIHDDFRHYQDIEDLIHDRRAEPVTKHWYVYDYRDRSPNNTIRIDANYEARNVRIFNGQLQLRQRAYSDTSRAKKLPISVSGIQTKQLDILHGSFRIKMKIEGETGGSCASFFWYHDNDSEVDIEAVTQGTSLVNNTINYTMHPSLDSDGNPIENATLSVPMGDGAQMLATFREHRFDCSPSKGVKYYLDGDMQHQNNHHIPHAGGTLQLKLWADGNKWWSGIPSTTDVVLSVASISAYYNTTASNRGQDHEWQSACEEAGGPSSQTVCETREGSQSSRVWQNSAVIQRPSHRVTHFWLTDGSLCWMICLWVLLMWVR